MSRLIHKVVFLVVTLLVCGVATGNASPFTYSLSELRQLKTQGTDQTFLVEVEITSRCLANIMLLESRMKAKKIPTLDPNAKYWLMRALKASIRHDKENYLKSKSEISDIALGEVKGNYNMYVSKYVPLDYFQTDAVSCIGYTNLLVDKLSELSQ